MSSTAKHGDETSPPLSGRRCPNVWRFDLRLGYRLGWANGIAGGVALVYALLFLPLAPYALLGVLFFGLGLIPLAPLLALVAAVVLGVRLYAAAKQAAVRLPRPWLPWGVGLFALLVVSLPMIVTRAGLQMANSESPEESARGVRWLRALGQREELLRACYGRVGRAAELYSSGKPITADAARAIFYRVYGQAFNAVPPPKLYAGRARWDVMEREYTWDNDQSGDAVAGRVQGLSLESSRQDGFVDAAAGLAYLEWTLEFKNVSRLQREARAQIILPPGGVVSRLTLWINGQEQEAAFGGRSQVKTAYKQVVRQFRDPVMVTTCGPDRVLMQCYPVPPGGGTMKVRLGITAPLSLTAADIGYLRWPYFSERNFSLSEKFAHALWVESRQPLESVGGQLKSEAGKPGAWVLRGQLREDSLANPINGLRARRPMELRLAWSKESREGDGLGIRQSLVERPVTAPERVIVVVDSTRGQEGFYREISAAFSKLPSGIDFALLLARDGCEELIPMERGTSDLYQRIALWKRQSDGGHDNLPALRRAWELAAQVNNSVILWVHGPQPVLMEPVDALRQCFERSAAPPRLFDLQTQLGPNRVLEALDGISSVRSVLRLGTVGDDLGRLFASWEPKGRTWEFVREQVPVSSLPTNSTGQVTSLHLARLWAANEVTRLCALRRPTEATELAQRYQLVTLISGAVVLETRAQYQQAGLQPVPPESVPAVPEPSVGGLLLLALVLWAIARRRGFFQRNFSI